VNRGANPNWRLNPFLWFLRASTRSTFRTHDGFALASVTHEGTDLREFLAGILVCHLSDPGVSVAAWALDCRDYPSSGRPLFVDADGLRLAKFRIRRIVQDRGKPFPRSLSS